MTFAPAEVVDVHRVGIREGLSKAMAECEAMADLYVVRIHRDVLTMDVNELIQTRAWVYALGMLKSVLRQRIEESK